MTIGFYSAKAGLLTMQEGLDVVSNNIANVSTTGYKALRPSFSDLLYTAEKKQNPEAQTGSGVKVSKTDLMYKPGQLLMTNRPLDFVTPTDGFFGLKDENGDLHYTRDGSFYMSKMGNDWSLVNGDGMQVLDYDKNPIKLTMKDGSVDSDKLMSDLGVFKFSNPYGLVAEGSNKYEETESSGVATADKDLVKLSNALELSTVDLADQMIKVIEYQRAFQANSSMLKTSDEIQSLINNMR